MSASFHRQTAKPFDSCYAGDTSSTLNYIGRSSICTSRPRKERKIQSNKPISTEINKTGESWCQFSTFFHLFFRNFSSKRSRNLRKLRYFNDLTASCIIFVYIQSLTIEYVLPLLRSERNAMTAVEFSGGGGGCGNYLLFSIFLFFFQSNRHQEKGERPLYSIGPVITSRYSPHSFMACNLLRLVKLLLPTRKKKKQRRSLW